MGGVDAGMVVVVVVMMMIFFTVLLSAPLSQHKNNNTQMAFHGIGTLRTASIVQVRTCVESMMAADYEEHKRRIQALLDNAAGNTNGSVQQQSKRVLQPSLNAIMEEEESSQSEVCYVSE